MLRVSYSRSVDGVAASLADRLDVAASTLHRVATSNQNACQQGKKDCTEARHISTSQEWCKMARHASRGGGNAGRANVAEQRCGGAMTAARMGNDQCGRYVPKTRSEEHTAEHQSIMR